MLYRLPDKTKQFFFVLIKLSIVMAAFYFIYQKLVNNTELRFSDFSDFLSKNTVLSLKNIVSLLLLSLFNWFFEVLKWQTLASTIKRITFKNALEQSLGALTASLFTPNRIGEYGAKAIYYNSNYRKQIMLTNLISNVSQMSATLMLGIIGLSFFISKYNLNLNYYRLSIGLIIVLTFVLLVGLFFKNNKFNIKGFSFEKIKDFILSFPKSKLILGVVYSLIRYAIFSFQFYCLLIIFKIDISYLNAMEVITAMYLLASVIPTIFVFDVVIKGSIAVYLFSFLGINEFTVLSIITFMWIFNFVLPSAFGSYYVLNFNLPKNND
tara:strand:+ start:4401 stop:5369 length:969 start_codon:yes stop_codon:yes gene_type:complete